MAEVATWPPLSSKRTELGEAFSRAPAIGSPSGVKAALSEHRIPPSRDSGTEGCEFGIMWIDVIAHVRFHAN